MALLPMALPRTIATHWNKIIHSHDELFADLFESNSDVPCQVGTCYIHVEWVVPVQQVYRVFWLNELDRLYEHELSFVRINAPRSLVQ
jgi:hypothetical protein